jgi:hypothetical protein
MILSRRRLPCAAKALQLSGIRFKRLHVSEPSRWADLIVEVDYEPTPELQRKIRSVVSGALNEPELYISINREGLRT